ncbi:recombinase family protein [Streptomyces chryseus]|uniref:recombinase family protein n=1 Tax=Streptomyces chryseus TaxID=68186 RepID=UPI00142ECDA4|nr:recombinase family protein [Streptomyces chryseus]GGX02288.1 resolvase-like protein [Streptomyces chryseus]
MPIAPEYLHHVYEGPFPTLLYARNSVDPKKKGRSVGDQLSEGRTLCASYGWPIVEEFKDTGISASRHARRKRDEFEELIEAIESGVARIVVAFEASRYYRDLEVYVRLRNACYAAGVLLCYNNTVYDLSKSADRKATAMDAIQAESESDLIRDRNLRTVRLNAEAGAPHGKIQFGYVRRYDPDTGDLIGQYAHPTHEAFAAEAFDKADTGVSTYMIAKWLRGDRKAARPDGAEWSEKLVKRMLLNPAYIGKRVFRGKIIRDATWPAIVKGPDGTPDVAKFNRVKARLTDPARRTQRDSVVAHLLSRIALCGECGDHALLTAGKRNKGRQYYNCKTAYDTALAEDRLDAYVEEALMRWLSSPEARAALLPDEGANEAKAAEVQQRLTSLNEQLDEARALATQFNEQGRPRLSVASLSALEASLEPDIKEAEAALEGMTGVSPVLQQLLTAKDPEDVWYGVKPEEATPERPARPALSLEQQRSVIRQCVTVRLFKASKKGVQKIEPGRIKLSYFGQPGYRARPITAREFAQQRAAETSQGSSAPPPRDAAARPSVRP